MKHRYVIKYSNQFYYAYKRSFFGDRYISNTLGCNVDTCERKLRYKLCKNHDVVKELVI